MTYDYTTLAKAWLETRPIVIVCPSNDLLLRLLWAVETYSSIPPRTDVWWNVQISNCNRFSIFFSTTAYTHHSTFFFPVEYLSEALQVDTHVHLEEDISTQTWTVNVMCTLTDMPNFEVYVNWYRHTENFFLICTCSYTSTNSCYVSEYWKYHCDVSAELNNSILIIYSATYYDQGTYICTVFDHTNYFLESSEISIRIPG